MIYLCVLFLRRFPRGLAEVSSSCGYIRAARRSRWQVRTWLDCVCVCCVCVCSYLCVMYAFYVLIVHEWAYSNDCMHACERASSVCVLRCMAMRICVLLNALFLSAMKIFITHRKIKNAQCFYVHVTCFCVKPLHETVAVTHIVYVIFKAERALLIPRQRQHCTFPNEKKTASTKTLEQA